MDTAPRVPDILSLQLILWAIGGKKSDLERHPALCFSPDSFEYIGFLVTRSVSNKLSPSFDFNIENWMTLTRDWKGWKGALASVYKSPRVPS